MATAVAPHSSEIENEATTTPDVEVRARIPRAELAVETSPPALYRLSVEQYEAMAEAGILDENDRIELIDGLLVSKMTKYPLHVVVTQLALAAIAQVIPAGWHIRKEDPIRIPDRASEPEPDIAVVKGAIRDYLPRHPQPGEVALVVEVAESSLVFDRVTKLQVYGGGGISVYWIVNVIDKQLEIYTEPSGPDSEPAGYRRTTILKPGESVTFPIEGTEVGPIAVADLLP